MSPTAVSSLLFGAGWSSPVARQAHNLKVAGSNHAPATNDIKGLKKILQALFLCGAKMGLVAYRLQCLPICDVRETFLPLTWERHPPTLCHK